jgi:hypothetical protein
MPQSINVPGIRFSRIISVGKNQQGYTFAVGEARGRWLGFALCRVQGQQTIFVFPEVSESSLMGLAAWEQAIRLTAAIAQAPEQGYGGVDCWHVPQHYRANPDDYRCEDCGEVGCQGECRQEAECFAEDQKP